MRQPRSPALLAAPRRKRWGRLALMAVAAAGLSLLVAFLLHLLLPRNYRASGEMLELKLPGGPQYVPFYCESPEPRGIVIVGSGDGGWSYWEENTARHLARSGYAVGGWDCRKFADSRTYDHAQLVDGYARAVEAVRERGAVDAAAPVWYGGWSTGAEQAVAAAASPDRPPHLAGLWLAAPGSRGRFGITKSDLLGGTPTGPGTFSLAEMGRNLRGLAVAQFAADLDPMDDVSWLDAYDGPKRVIRMAGLLHDMGGAGETFQAALDDALAWTMNPHP